MPSVISRRWVFTLNNYTAAEEQHVTTSAGTDRVDYLIYGRERGESGTPHLQGFFIVAQPITARQAKALISGRCHIEKARGTSEQARDYCKKDGDFVEFGIFPRQRGRRTDWDAYKDWLATRTSIPTRREILLEFPALCARYPEACLEYAEAIIGAPRLTDSAPRPGWQQDLARELASSPDSRSIRFLVDPEGNSGKSWFCKWCLSDYPDSTQVFRVGRRDDLAHVISVEKTIFLFDIPRGQMDFLQYSILEMLKDRMVFSPKYHSTMKTLRSLPHVVVFCNEQPDMTKLSRDRYSVTTIS